MVGVAYVGRMPLNMWLEEVNTCGHAFSREIIAGHNGSASLPGFCKFLVIARSACTIRGYIFNGSFRNSTRIVSSDKLVRLLLVVVG